MLIDSQSEFLGTGKRPAKAMDAVKLECTQPANSTTPFIDERSYSGRAFVRNTILSTGAIILLHRRARTLNSSKVTDTIRLGDKE